MRNIARALLLVLLFPVPASALNTDDLLATIAMPLAVAAVAKVAHVPNDQLSTLVSALNQANVPPTGFVQVIRYAPVALVDQNGRPFIAYVREQTTQGTTGDALVNAIATRLQSSYGIQPQLTLAPESAPAYVLSDTYIPGGVTARLDSSDALAAVALPLAVAAVADVTGVPQDQLANLVATLNQANVPVVEEVHVIRYVPVALVDTNGQFVQFVQQQVSQGVTGPALVPVVTQQLQAYYPSQVTVSAPAPRTVIVDEHFVPTEVVTRVAEVRAHPHGGPPGQIKKQLGLQTGAEVVHGFKPGRHERSENAPMASSVPVPAPAPVVIAPRAEEHEHGRGRDHDKHAVVAPPPAVVAPPPATVAAPPPPPQGKGHDEGGPPGQAKGKGNAKGHGKD